MSETLSSGLTLIVPSQGDVNWASSIKTNCFQKISEHDHTGSGKGLPIGTGAISNLAITTAKIAAGAVTPTELASDAVITAKILDLNVTLGKLAAAVQEALVPAGSILPTGRSTAPTGYLLCDGAAVSRATYAALFTAISTAYGVGDGATTFNLPNLQGRFPLGKAAAGTGSTLGGTGGSLDHTHTGPSHTHPLSSNGQALAHSEFIAAQNTLSYKKATASSWNADYKIQVTGLEGAVGGGATTDAFALSGATDAAGTGSTGAANPAFQTVNYIIKT